MQFTTPIWDCFEFSIQGPHLADPFSQANLTAEFSFGHRVITVSGFYDGADTWRVRFMPDTHGDWTFKTKSNLAELDGKTGTLVCGSARPGMHGPVRVKNQFHFAHADGKVYLPFGTTCYAWTHQPKALQAQTLETLEKTRFNKLRMGVFPKDYIYNENEPLYPMFEKRPDGSEDFSRPNVEAFQWLDRQVAALREMGIEADIILFHPYDRWGYCAMGEQNDHKYLRYVIARLAAYSNVWWSLANEYDFLLDVKPMAYWDRLFNIVEEADPYRHLKSVHNGKPDANYDHRKPWVDHVCMQNWDVKLTPEWRSTWGKPVINDEPEYEGNIPRPWGNISALELVHRYWITLLRGGYAGHGETFMHPEDEIWWAKGGVLRGESWKRIGFLRDLLEEDVKNGLDPYLAGKPRWEFTRVSGAQDGDVRYLYFGEHQPAQWAVGLPQVDGDYEIDLIDIWEMTVTPLQKAPLPPSPALRGGGGIVHNTEPEAAFSVRLPGKPYQAVRVRVRK